MGSCRKENEEAGTLMVIWDEPESVKGRVRVHKVRGGCFTRSLQGDSSSSEDEFENIK